MDQLDQFHHPIHSPKNPFQIEEILFRSDSNDYTNCKAKWHSCNHTHCRRIEDKLDARQLLNQLITIRMECPPASKRVPLQMFGWVVMLEGAEEDNIFKASPLMTDRPEILKTWYSITHLELFTTLIFSLCRNLFKAKTWHTDRICLQHTSKPPWLTQVDSASGSMGPWIFLHRASCWERLIASCIRGPTESWQIQVVIFLLATAKKIRKETPTSFPPGGFVF